MMKYCKTDWYNEKYNRLNLFERIRNGLHKNPSRLENSIFSAVNLWLTAIVKFLSHVQSVFS